MNKILIILLILLIPSTLAVTYPTLTDFVTDNADIISPEYEQQISELAKQIEQETSVEIAIVTVKSLEGISKEDYAIELAEKNGIGKEDIDNGLLILVALDEREYRVEVGYGLEGLIPDSSKVTIGTRILEPNFKQGEFGKGIYESLLVMQGLVKGEEEVLSEYKSTYTNRQGSSIRLWFYIIFFALFFFGGIFGRRKGRGRGFMFIPLFLPGPRGGFSGGSGGFGSSGFGGFGGGGFGGGGFGGSF